MNSMRKALASAPTTRRDGSGAIGALAAVAYVLVVVLIGLPLS